MIAGATRARMTRMSVEATVGIGECRQQRRGPRPVGPRHAARMPDTTYSATIRPGSATKP
jgi:hypothetical protein